MIQELFHIGPLSISPFGVMLMLAFLAGYFQLAWGMKRLGAGDAEDASAIMLWSGFAGILGGKVYYAILHGDWRLILERSGIVWYGSFLAGTAAVWWIVRRRDLPAWRTADAAAPGLALGYAIGRIGCFLVGDDYGVPSDVPWAVAFPHGLPPSQAHYLREFGVAVDPGLPGDTLLRVHPTQVYETLLALAIFGLGVWMIRKGRPEGAVTLTVVALLAIERFGIELLRAKDDRFLGALTVAQAISLAILLASLILAWRRRSRAVASREAPAR
jgi:phosphatidylglycerol:prolipoprotein diacylglycerol transferase